MQDWKLSIGTAGAIGLRHLKTDAPPTTAYIMLGERCLRNCAFCAQARASTAGAKFLSRVAWHGEEEERAIRAIGAAYKEGKIKRVCLQVVETPDSFAIVARALAKFKAYPGLPVVVSCHVANVAQAEHLFALGAARLGQIAATGAAPEAILRAPPAAEVIAPVTALAPAFEAAYARFRAAYPAIRPVQ